MSSIKDLLFKASEGLLSTTVDLTLLTLFTTLSLAGKSKSQIYQGFDEAHDLLEDINYQSIKKAIYNLTAKGYLTRSPKRSSLEISITKLGYQRIKSFLPTYHNKRPWDNHVYLISYDIPTKHNYTRDLLREYIRRTGGGLLQESLWLNPYNPSGLLEEFVKTHRIPGTILVSKLGKDGTIGNQSLKSLINKTYAYKNLQSRYQEFISTYSTKPMGSLLKFTLNYHAILKEDPQLPFPLEPKNFLAKKAHQLFSSYTNYSNRTVRAV